LQWGGIGRDKGGGRPLKILQVTTELRIAGAERVVAGLSCELRSRGHDVAVVSLAPSPADSSQSVGPELLAAGVQVVSLGVTKLTPWRALRLRRITGDFAPDIIHAHLIHANLATRLFGRIPGRPLINTVHIAERRASARWHFWLDRLTLSRCTVQTAVSQAVRDYHAPRIGVEPAAMPVVYDGIRMPRACTEARISELRAAWGVADAARVIGSVGRLNQQKGYDILLRALSALGPKVPCGETWAVVILGDGPERPRLEKLAGTAPGNIRVVLPGFRPDAADCIGAFDLFVMPSRYEGFGLTLAEAMAHGVPVMVADVDSLPELVAGYPQGQTWGFSHAEPDATAEALLQYSAQPKVRPHQLYQTTEMADRYLDIYHTCLQRNARHQPAAR
jgi:glycosyltransferase involved in cell wall biosynthesis